MGNTKTKVILRAVVAVACSLVLLPGPLHAKTSPSRSAAAQGTGSGPAEAGKATESPRFREGLNRISSIRGEREFVLRIPASASEPVPVIVALHAPGAGAGSFDEEAGLSVSASKAGIATLFPLARSASGIPNWDIPCCMRSSSQEDLQFIETIAVALRKDPRFAKSPVHLLGFSTGALLARELAARRPDLFRSVSLVAGGAYAGSAAPASGLPFLSVNGDRDPLVPVEGGPSSGPFSAALGGGSFVPWTELSLPWARAAGCADRARTTDLPGYSVLGWTCPKGRGVHSILVNGLGHEWPVKKRSAIDATQEILRFIQEAGRNGS